MTAGGWQMKRRGAPGGPPMRRLLALVAAAVSSMIALAFVIPLGLAIRQVAYDRALHDAERQATSLSLVLEGTQDRLTVELAMAKLPAGRDGQLGVHLIGGSKPAVYGAQRA